MGDFNAAVANFALDLFRTVSTPQANAFLSPVSISVALAMTYAGADGNTSAQMKRVMFPGVEDSKVHDKFSELMGLLNAPTDAAYKLHTANRLYAEGKYAFLPEFFDLLRSRYQSEVAMVDFVSAAEKVRSEINSWVSHITNEKIQDLIPTGVLDASTRLVLVNAIYFKGTWQKKFKEANTKKKTFHVQEGKEVQVDMMGQTASFLYGGSEEVQVLGMPYRSGGGRELAMFVLLPKERFGLEKFEQSLTGEKFLDLIKKTSSTEVMVEMPKFRLEQSFSLGKALSDLGMGEMFSASADFSKMTGNRDLFVSAVLHKAFIEVNEEGSEAAAATAVAMNRRCAMAPRDPPRFLADHPFLFGIVEVEGPSLLFLGHMTHV
jgi:serpin B